MIKLNASCYTNSWRNKNSLYYQTKNGNEASWRKGAGIWFTIGYKNRHPWSDKQRVGLHNRKHPYGAPSVYSGLRAVACAYFSKLDGSPRELGSADGVSAHPLQGLLLLVAPGAKRRVDNSPEQADAVWKQEGTQRCYVSSSKCASASGPADQEVERRKKSNQSGNSFEFYLSIHSSFWRCYRRKP